MLALQKRGATSAAISSLNRPEVSHQRSNGWNSSSVSALQALGRQHGKFHQIYSIIKCLWNRLLEGLWNKFQTDRYLEIGFWNKQIWFLVASASASLTFYVEAADRFWSNHPRLGPHP